MSKKEGKGRKEAGKEGTINSRNGRQKLELIKREDKEATPPPIGGRSN